MQVGDKDKNGRPMGARFLLSSFARSVLNFAVDRLFNRSRSFGPQIRPFMDLNWWSCRGTAPRVRKAGLTLSPGSASNLS